MSLLVKLALNRMYLSKLISVLTKEENSSNSKTEFFIQIANLL